MKLYYTDLWEEPYDCKSLTEFLSSYIMVTE